MTIKKPSVIKLENGQQWLLLDAKRIMDRNFGVFIEVKKDVNADIKISVAELQVIDGQAHVGMFEGSESSDELIKAILAS